MKKFEDEEYFLFRALSGQVKSGLIPALEKVSKQCESIIEEVEEIDKKLEMAESCAQVNAFSKSSLEKRDELIRLLAIKSRIQELIKRNDEREQFINKILQDAGIYNESFDKKKIAEIEKQEIEHVSAENLNLNFKDAKGNTVVFEFLDGEVLKTLNGKIDFSNESNKRIFKESGEEFILTVIKTHPECVAEIPVSMIVDTSFKKRVLKAIATFVVDETKKKDIKQVNKELGDLLEFKTEITATAEDYIAGVTNMFNVQIKQFLMENADPEKQIQIDGKLKCNEKSELIPESKRVAVLAGGIAGDIAPEAEESEEERIAREKEIQKQVEHNTIDLKNREIDVQETADISKEIESLEREIKRAQEEEKKMARKQVLQEQEELEQEQMQRVLSVDRFDD